MEGNLRFRLTSMNAFLPVRVRSTQRKLRKRDKADDSGHAVLLSVIPKHSRSIRVDTEIATKIILLMNQEYSQ